jgi:hypothetical protein
MVKPKIASTDKIAAKWGSVTPSRASDYEAGVKDPKADWETNTVAAAANYKAAVSSGDIQRRFTGGAKKAGTGKWQKKATTLGKDRFGPGVQAAVPDFQAGFEPFNSVIAGVDMSDRKPRGDPANYDRSKQVGAALTAKRIALRTAGA